MNALIEHDISGSVIVTRGSDILFSEGLGMANLGERVPNTDSTKHRIGSITKQFTAMAVLILQDRGALSTVDSVGDHLGDIPESWSDLTLHQLLTHTSGLMHTWNLPGFSETMGDSITLDESLDRYFDYPLLFEPGTDFAYSGVGYLLLAKIIETVSGGTYEEFLEREVFTPLGMMASGADRPEADLTNRALGYVPAPDGSVSRAPHIYMPLLSGGGNLYSTVLDLSKWDQALSAGGLISPEAYEAMFRPELENFAYGWVIGVLRGRRTFSHSGGMPGFQAHIIRFPDDGIFVAVLTNVSSGQARAAAEEVAAIVIAAGTG